MKRRSWIKGKKKWLWKHTAEGKRAGIKRKQKAMKEGL